MTYEATAADGYIISDDGAGFDLVRAHGWIAEKSYWARQIPWETFARAVRNSLVLGAYAADGQMVAMARVVTDRATFAWLCDVYVDEAHRGSGLGKALVAAFLDHPDLQGLRRRHLATADAHGLYEAAGFSSLTGADRWMEILDREVYSRAGSTT
jgi:GNAT superfamily N-acetyltransferase